MIPIESESPRVSVPLGPSGLDIRKIITAYRAVPDLDGSVRDLTKGVDIYVILRSGDPKQELVRTVKKIRVIDADEEISLPKNPQIERWTIEESEVVNINDPCVQSARASLANPIGLERDDLQQEISAVDSCIVHAKAKVSVKLELDDESKSDEDFEESVYTWYTDNDVYANEPVNETAMGVYKLPNRKGVLDLIFTVRTAHGGFTIAKQELIVIENKDGVVDSNF